MERNNFNIEIHEEKLDALRKEVNLQSKTYITRRRSKLNENEENVVSSPEPKMPTDIRDDGNPPAAKKRKFEADDRKGNFRNFEYLDQLPDCILFNILEFLNYDTIAQMRGISKRFDLVCRSKLNMGFLAAERLHAKCLKEVKSKLPRRESDRRQHPLSSHCDVLTAIETRISLLSMTYMKPHHLDSEICCFIPGKVIDELFRVLKVVKESYSGNPKEIKGLRALEILQELRDISSMAMEHFDEKISPELIRAASSVSSPGSSTSFCSPRKAGESPSFFLAGDFSTIGFLSRENIGASPRFKMVAGGSGNPKFVEAEKYGRDLSKSEKCWEDLKKKYVSLRKTSFAAKRDLEKTIGDQKSRISALEETLSAQQTVIGSQTDVIKRLQAQMEEVYNAIPCLKSKFQESQSPLVLEIAKTKSLKEMNKRKREEDR